MVATPAPTAWPYRVHVADEREGRNLSVTLPTEFFVIVTKDAGPVIQWNLSLGRIASAGAAFAQQYPDVYNDQRDRWLPWLPNPEFQTFVGFHSFRVTADIRAEYHAELLRIEEFRGLPSRMACLYAWSSLEDARLAKRTIRGRFSGKIIRCTPAGILRAVRCNSALVNFAQRAERRGFLTDADTIRRLWRTYWSGSGEPLRLERQNLVDPAGPPETVTMSQEPLWEWLIDGSLKVEGDAEPSA